MIHLLRQWYRQRRMRTIIQQLQQLQRREYELEDEVALIVELAPDDYDLVSLEQDAIIQDIRKLRGELRGLTRRPSDIRPGHVEWQTLDQSGELRWVDDAPPQFFLNERVHKRGPATERQIMCRNHADVIEHVRELAYR